MRPSTPSSPSCASSSSAGGTRWPRPCRYGRPSRPSSGATRPNRRRASLPPSTTTGRSNTWSTSCTAGTPVGRTGSTPPAVNPYRVIYEEFVNTRAATVGRVLDALGIDPPELRLTANGADEPPGRQSVTGLGPPFPPRGSGSPVAGATTRSSSFLAASGQASAARGWPESNHGGRHPDLDQGGPDPAQAQNVAAEEPADDAADQTGEERSSPRGPVAGRERPGDRALRSRSR